MISISSLRDRGLARAVVVERQPVDHVARVAGRVVHGRHPRALLGGRVLQQRPEDLGREGCAAAASPGSRLLGLELVDRLRRRPRSARLFGSSPVAGRQPKGMSCWRRDDLRDGRLEPVVDHRADIETVLVRREREQHGSRWPAPRRNSSRGRPTSSIVSTIRLPWSRGQLAAALAADAEDLDRLALGRQLADQLPRLAHDRRVEAAAKAAVGGRDDQKVHVVLARAGQQRRRALGLPLPSPRRDRAQHALHALGDRGARPRPASCARRSLAAATIFMAEVIFCVDLTLLIRCAGP